MSERVSPIRSELLAAKIEKLWNFELPELYDEFSEEPRYLRALWFLEHVSKPQNYAGGLTKFAQDFIVASADKIGTPTMVRLSGAQSYEPEEAVAILGELRQCDVKKILGADSWIFENAFLSKDGSGHAEHVTVERVIEHHCLNDGEDELQTWTGSRRELYRVLVARLTPAIARELCSRHVAGLLATFFKEVCELPHVGFRPAEVVDLGGWDGEVSISGDGPPRYFAQAGTALLSFMEKRSNDLRRTLAETEVTRLVHRWMHKAQAMNEPVMFSGNSRFGKTEAVELLCDMNPGVFRIVNTPASNAIGDLFREVARSLGIEVGAQNCVRDLRERIEYVLRFSRIVLCFDEFQFVLPGSYSRNTAPARLNWVRRAVLDQKLAAVFVCTPQSYLPAKKRFMKATGFAMEQFDERVLKTVHLPNELSEGDLFAVARIHFSNLDDECLQLVVKAALATERNYISDISKIATLAKDNARENGRLIPLLCDIEEAIVDVLPSLPRHATASAAEPLKTQIAAPIPQPCTRSATSAQSPRISPLLPPKSQRGMQPLTVKT